MLFSLKKYFIARVANFHVKTTNNNTHTSVDAHKVFIDVFFSKMMIIYHVCKI